jgi:hypothetical protein
MPDTNNKARAKNPHDPLGDEFNTPITRLLTAVACPWRSGLLSRPAEGARPYGCGCVASERRDHRRYASRAPDTAESDLTHEYPHRGRAGHDFRPHPIPVPIGGALQREAHQPGGCAGPGRLAGPTPRVRLLQCASFARTAEMCPLPRPSAGVLGRGSCEMSNASADICGQDPGDLLQPIFNRPLVAP